MGLGRINALTDGCQLKQGRIPDPLLGLGPRHTPLDSHTDARI